jgi:hypothetical protein
MTVRERPLFTDEFSSSEDFSLGPGAAYISGRTPEQRSLHVDSLVAKTGPGARFVEVVEGELTFDAGDLGTFDLLDRDDLKRFWGSLGEADCYLDITGLSHPVWAALLVAARDLTKLPHVVYVEPLKYRRNEISEGGDLFDLTTGFHGIAPLPGLISLRRYDDDDAYFVPLLGFEGRRFSYMVNEVAPIGDHVIPVVGVPGFQPEFVGFAFDGNKVPLLQDDAWQRVKFATANCPFSLFYLLEDLLARRPSAHFIIAPIGTKPHSLGAVLFALAHPESTELVYDHPQRKAKRTEGKARLLLYHLEGLRPSLIEAGT